MIPFVISSSTQCTLSTDKVQHQKSITLRFYAQEAVLTTQNTEE